MAIQQIIKYEGDNDVLIYKHPEEDFNTLSQLIVHESQEAVFFSDGQALDTFRAGRYTLETKNIPLISKLRNLVSGGVSPFHVEVYFINLATMMDVIWGTPSQVVVRDPNYGYSYNVGANGSFGLKIKDGRKVLINLVGTEEELSTKHIQKYFKDLIITRVKNYIAVELGKYSYNQINMYLNEISDGISRQIKEDISEYGIEILNFFVSGININEGDLAQLKKLDNSLAQKKFEALGNKEAGIIEAEGRARSREIEGYSWQQEQQFDVSKTFAQNEGFASNPANMMAQMPIAFTMGNMMSQNINQAYPVNQDNGNTTNNTANKQNTEENNNSVSGGFCSKCGKEIMSDAAFCAYCGNPVSIKKVCVNCGQELQSGMMFCPKCGTRRND